MLSTPVMESDGKPRCLDFYYHMYGSGIGSLVVSVGYDGISSDNLKITGNQGNWWNYGATTIDVPNGEKFQVSLVAEWSCQAAMQQSSNTYSVTRYTLMCSHTFTLKPVNMNPVYCKATHILLQN